MPALSVGRTWISGGGFFGPVGGSESVSGVLSGELGVIDWSSLATSALEAGSFSTPTAGPDSLVTGVFRDSVLAVGFMLALSRGAPRSLDDLLLLLDFFPCLIGEIFPPVIFMPLSIAFSSSFAAIG